MSDLIDVVLVIGRSQVPATTNLVDRSNLDGFVLVDRRAVVRKRRDLFLEAHRCLIKDRYSIDWRKYLKGQGKAALVQMVANSHHSTVLHFFGLKMSSAGLKVNP
jgi:hypothetical protein